MFKRFVTRFFFFYFLVIIYSTSSFANPDIESNDPQIYIDFAVGTQKHDPLSAMSALEKAYQLAVKQHNIPLIVEVLLEQAQVATNQKDYLSAKSYLNKAQKIAEPLNDITIKVDILFNMASLQRKVKNYKPSMEFVEKALALAKENHKTTLVFKALRTKGELLKSLKRFDDSVRVYLLAQRYFSAVSEANQVKLYRDIANAYKKVNELDSSIRYFTKALKLLEVMNERTKMAKTLIDIAQIQAKIGRYTSAILNAKRSLEFAREYDNEKEQLKALVGLSTLYRKVSSYEKSLLHGLEALKIYKKKGDANGIAAAANSVGLIYVHLGQNDNASSYFDQVIDLPSDSTQEKYRAAALRELGKLYVMDEKAEKGLTISNQAFAIYEQIEDKNGVATVLKNIGYIHFKLGEVTQASNSYNTAIILFQELGDVWNEAATKTRLANLLIESNTAQATKLAQESLIHAYEIGAKSIAEEAYSVLILTEEKSGNFQQALNYAKKKASVINEIKADTITKRLAEIHIVLEAEKEELKLKEKKRKQALILSEESYQALSKSIHTKDDRIETLTDQRTALIAAIILLLLLKCYFQLQTRYTLLVVLAASVLLFSFSSHSTDIIKLTRAESALDLRTQYTHAVLKEALEVSSEKYGPYKIEFLVDVLTSQKKIIALHDGDKINLAMAMASADWEYLSIPIRIPIRRGIANYRLLTINKKNAEIFKEITTKQQLKALTVGVQKDWVLKDILESEEFNLVESGSYDGVFKMLNHQRFDYVPRGIYEAYDEILLREKELPNLMVEPKLALYIPQPYYIFVSPKFPNIAERIEFGLETMIAQGTLQQMLQDHYGYFLKKADIANRTIINIGNKQLTKNTPFNRKELWLNFDLEKE